MGIIREYSPILEIVRVAKKDLKDNKDNNLHLGRKYARIFVLGHYRKTVRFAEQIISAEKYPSIFSRQMATIVYLVNSQLRLLHF